jgi:hypothetical protein
VKKDDFIYYGFAGWMGAALAISGITVSDWRFWLLYLSALAWVAATDLRGDSK